MRVYGEHACPLRNGSYRCHRGVGHEGDHGGRILTSKNGNRRWRVYTFADSYSPVVFAK